MRSLIAVHDWLGLYGDSLEPASLQFTIRPATTCRSCLFDGQKASVCEQACTTARRAELPHCEEGFIYVRREVDDRQLHIEEF